MVPNAGQWSQEGIAATAGIAGPSGPSGALLQGLAPLLRPLRRGRRPSWPPRARASGTATGTRSSVHWQRRARASRAIGC